MATTTRPALVKGSRASRSTIALKLTMAVSGLIFIGYVLVHMYGNLKAFSGQEAFNSYAEHIREIGEPILPHEGFLWIARAVLLLALAVHVYSAVALWRRAGKARSTKYVVKKNKNSSLSSHWMRWGGRRCCCSSSGTCSTSASARSTSTRVRPAPRPATPTR